MSISNYQGAANWANLETMLGTEGQTYVKVYNHTASAISNGAVYVLAYSVDATDTTNPIIKGIPLAAATNAGSCNVIIVAENSPKDQSTIPAYSYGWFCVKGYCTALVDGDTADVAVGDQLEILNGGTAFTLKTAATLGVSPIVGNTAAAIAMQANTGAAALKKVCLIGSPVVIAAS